MWGKQTVLVCFACGMLLCCQFPWIQASVRRSCTDQAKLCVHPVLEAVHTRSLSWPALCWLGSFLLKSPLNIIKKIAKKFCWVWTFYITWAPKKKKKLSFKICFHFRQHYPRNLWGSVRSENIHNMWNSCVISSEDLGYYFFKVKANSHGWMKQSSLWKERNTSYYGQTSEIDQLSCRCLFEISKMGLKLLRKLGA